MPRGFADHSEHRHADIIRLKQLIAKRTLLKTAWLNITAADRAVETIEALSVFYHFVDGASS